MMPDLAAAAPHLDPVVAQRAALAYTCAVERGRRADHFLVADMSLPSAQPRLFVFDLSDPRRPTLIKSTRVAHGAGSDPEKTGQPVRFGNGVGSGETSLGLYRVAERFVGARSAAYRLDGLTPGFNDAARDRAVVLHPAVYVREDGPVGRSLGCPAISTADFTSFERQGLLNDSLVWIDGPDASLEHASSLHCSDTDEVRACKKDNGPWRALQTNPWGVKWAG